MDRHQPTARDFTRVDRSRPPGPRLRVDVSRLEPGMVFDRRLEDPAGEVLLLPDAPLTPEMCAALASGGVAVFTLADPEIVASSDSEGDDLGPIPANEPRPRSERRLLWDRQRANLRARADLRRSAESIIERRAARWPRLPGIDALRPVEPRIVVRSSLARSDHFRFAEQRDRVEVLVRVIRRVLDGAEVDAAPVLDLADELLDIARRGPADALALATREIGFDPSGIESIMDHSWRVGAACAGASVALAWSPADARAAVLSGLLADSGLALLPPGVRSAHRPLADEGLNQVRRHPAYSVAIVERMLGTAGDALPEIVQRAVFEHHERENASGYPLWRRGPEIHEISKLVGVCDVLVGLTTDRADRPAADLAAAQSRLALDAARGVLAPWAVRVIVELARAQPAHAHPSLALAA